VRKVNGEKYCLLTDRLNIFLLAIPKHVCFQINNKQCLSLSQITTTFVTNMLYPNIE